MVTDPTDWCYASGIASVLETFLLMPRAVGELVESGTPDELLSRARRNPVYANVHASGAEDPMHIAASLESALVEFAQTFAGQCADARIVDLFLIEYDLRDLANYLKSEHCGIERRPVELSRVPRDDIEDYLAERPRLRQIADELAHVAEAEHQRVEPARVDLMIDGALLGLLPELAGPLGSEHVTEWARARQRLAAIEAVVRAQAAGIGRADIEDHLLRHLPPDSDAAALAAVEPDELARAVAELLPDDVPEGLDPTGGAASIQGLGARFDAALDRLLDPARTVAFGAERVFSCLRRLFTENRNLRAALGGFAGRIEPALVAQSLRGV